MQPDQPVAPRVQSAYGLVDRPDLTGYRIKAVVDWIAIEFTTDALRSAFALRQKVRASHVENLTNSGINGTSFCARFQDPESAVELRTQLVAAGAKNLRVIGIEIAVDFLPLHAQASADMPVMCAHLLRGLKNPMDFARFGKHGPGISQMLSFRDAIRQFDSGATCYLGHKADFHTQRLYVKRTDNSGSAIAGADHRARIENTYASPDGFTGDMEDLIDQVIGKNDFAFRRMVTPDSTMGALLASRVTQAGARALRSGRTLYDRNTKADIELNRRVADSLRGLQKRWASKPRSAEIAGEISSASLGERASSNNYLSINTDCQGEELTKVQATGIEVEEEMGREKKDEGKQVERQLPSPWSAMSDVIPQVQDVEHVASSASTASADLPSRFHVPVASFPSEDHVTQPCLLPAGVSASSLSWLDEFFPPVLKSENCS
ncbi:MAG: hypothetical protein AB9M53_07370 [Leptothrix sp. (in: b-proteobacteria)]